MSKANNPIKVLRVALKRVEKGWAQSTWHSRRDGQSYVCLEGAIYGFCAGYNATDAQNAAIGVLQDIIEDRYDGKYCSIPNFNDAPGRTQDEVMEVIKLGIIRLETDAMEADLADEVSDLFDSAS